MHTTGGERSYQGRLAGRISRIGYFAEYSEMKLANLAAVGDALREMKVV